MTQYYEKEARELEAQANQSNDPGEQNQLWARAAQIGTPIQYCEDGFCELDRNGEGCTC